MEEDKTHVIYHDFLDKFYDIENEKFLKTGYDLMVEVEKWAEDHPLVRISNCDDDWFMGSFLVLIPHEGMGHSVVFIPQNRQEPSRFFLYPGDMRFFIEDLTKCHQEIPERCL